MMRKNGACANMILVKNEVKTIFSEYRAEYQDRGIICYIFKDKNEMLYEEKM